MEAFVVIVILVVLPDDVQVLGCQLLVGQTLAQIHLRILLKFGSHPSFKSVIFKSFLYLLLFDFRKVIKMVDVASGSREIEVGALGQPLDGLHYRDLVVVRAVLVGVVGAAVVRAVADPFVLRGESVAFR